MERLLPDIHISGGFKHTIHGAAGGAQRRASETEAGRRTDSGTIGIANNNGATAVAQRRIHLHLLDLKDLSPSS